MAACLSALFLSTNAEAQTVSLKAYPKQLQIVQRDVATNKGTVACSGLLKNSPAGRLVLQAVLLNNTVVDEADFGPFGSVGTTGISFSMDLLIPAELTNHAINLVFEPSGGGGSQLLHSVKGVCAGDVFVVSGQSNALIDGMAPVGCYGNGAGQIAPPNNYEFARTFGFVSRPHPDDLPPWTKGTAHGSVAPTTTMPLPSP